MTKIANKKNQNRIQIPLKILSIVRVSNFKLDLRASLSGDNLCIGESRYARDLVGGKYARY